MARTHNPSKLLGIDMQQIAGGGMLVVLDGLGRIEILQMRQAGTGQHPTHRTLGHAETGRNTGLGQSMSAQLYDRQRLGRGNAPRLRAGRDDRSVKPASPWTK